MSDPSAPPGADTGEALARMAAFDRNDTARKRSTAWGPLVVVFVLLIPLSAVAWLALQQSELQSELITLRADNAALQQLSATSTSQFAQVQERQQELDATVQQTLQQEQAANAEALDAQAQQLAALESEVAALATDLAATRSRASMADGGSPLAEAEVLLRFAQQRLVLARDTTTAIELFLAADEVLRGITDPAVVNVRESLAREVAALRALPAVDVPGIFAQLSARAAQVDSIAVVSASSVRDFTVGPAAPAASAEEGWWSRVQQSFGEYFVVSSSSGEVLPQLNAGEQLQLRALVQLQIEQAKLALLRGDPQLFRAALDDALATSRRWLRAEDGSVDEFMTALATLRDTSIVVEVPAMDQTLNAVRRLSATSPAQ